ncbi:MAG: DUF4105 domain-containing protein [Bacteroidales bacterium]|nr:DUF4105 domain-containing protein [Bacteroidales bacterium]
MKPLANPTSKLLAIAAMAAALAMLSTSTSAQTIAATTASSLRISVVTCEAGHDIPSAFGHVAIRLRDTSAQHPLDLVFDYGTFNFDEPMFLPKFARGNLLYYLSVRSFEQFYDEYSSEQRRVTEQLLQLTEPQHQRIAEMLFNNYQPQNRYYLYDFITDNCATRIRDILEHPDFTHPIQGPDSSYRQLIHRYLTHKPWLGLAVDILLGPSTDSLASFGQALFLPYTISNGLTHYRNQITNQPLASPTQVLIEGRTAQHHGLWREPWALFSLLLAITAGLALTKRTQALHYMALAVFGVLSLLGLLLLFLWIGSRYSCTNMNLNLLWCLPLYPLLLLPIGSTLKRSLLLLQCAMLATVLLLGWWGLPQHFNVAVYPLAATLLIMNIGELRHHSK